jgi:hypothetical protein
MRTINGLARYDYRVFDDGDPRRLLHAILSRSNVLRKVTLYQLPQCNIA